MAGHSHWAQIKRQKGTADVRRGQLFSKLSKEISVAARMGGGDAGFNPRLRRAIETARAESMPVDKIERAVKKGLGELGGSAIEEIIYEGYGPGGVALLVEVATDNKNRTAAEVRAIFSKNEGNLAGAGSVAWMFKKKGYFLIENATEETVFEVGLEAGAEEVQKEESGVSLICSFEQFDILDKALKTAGFSASTAKATYIAENFVPVTALDTANALLNLIDKLEENEDVQNVYGNYDISPELWKQLEGAK